LPKRSVCFSRYNILLRDDFTCQYCSKRLSKGSLNLDHVVPRSRGGKTSWTNVVTSCHHCNRKKGGFLPHEVGMKLKRVPTKPSAISYFAKNAGKVHYREWLPFLNMIDFSYWNVELEE
ncbi:MAG: HNH endonuclease, partial [Pseudomonadota bacterium]